MLRNSCYLERELLVQKMEAGSLFAGENQDSSWGLTAVSYVIIAAPSPGKVVWIESDRSHNYRAKSLALIFKLFQGAQVSSRAGRRSPNLSPATCRPAFFEVSHSLNTANFHPNQFPLKFTHPTTFRDCVHD